MVSVAEWAYESSDRAAEQGRSRLPLLPGAVIALMERYAG